LGSPIPIQQPVRITPWTQKKKKMREPGCRGSAFPGCLGTGLLAPHLPHSPSAALRRAACGAGTVRGSPCSGEYSLLATNPGVEPVAGSGVALPSLLALAAAQKTRHTGVLEARLPGSAEARHARRGRGAWARSRLDMLSARRGKRAPGRCSCWALPWGRCPQFSRSKLGEGTLPDPQAFGDECPGSCDGA
jgi:hypothetical protein